MKIWKKWWELLGSYLLNSTANPAQSEQKWDGLAVLFSRQPPTGSHDFFQTFSIYLFNHFMKNPQTTIALPFLIHNFSAIGDVASLTSLRLATINIWSLNFQGTPKIFFHMFSIHFSNYLIKNPKTTNAPTFLTHIILLQVV